LVRSSAAFLSDALAVSAADCSVEVRVERLHMGDPSLHIAKSV
jgi:hypothetical protein